MRKYCRLSEKRGATNKCLLYKEHLNRTRYLGLSQSVVDTHRLLPFSKDSARYHLIFTKSSKWQCRFILFWFYFNCGGYGSWRFLNFTHLYINKKHFNLSFTFDAHTVWNDVPDNFYSAPTLVCFRNKIKPYLFK